MTREPHDRLAQRVLDATPDHVSVIDRELVYRYVNPAYERAHGQSAASIVGTSVRELLGEDTFQRFVEPRLARALAGEEVAYEAWFDFVEVGRRFMQVRYLPMRSADQTIDAVMVLSHDATERRLAEDALRESEAKYRSYISLAPHGVFVADGAGRYLEVNPAAVRMTGFSEAELLSMGVAELTTKEFLQESLSGFQELRERGRLQQRVQIERKNAAPFWIHLSAAKLDEQRYLGFCEDVSVHVEMEERLRQSQKMEAIGLLAGGVAHDFNNLLTAILANASLVLARPLDDRSRSELSEIVSVANRAADLTRQLLAFSQRRPRSLGTARPDQVIRDLGQLLARLIGEHIELQTSLGAPDAHVAMDRTGLEQIVVNLVVNARDAMPEGGRVRIVTRTELPKPDPSAPADSIPIASWVLEVVDEGHGMDAETRARVFEPFFTTKAPGAGSGLGLSTVYGLVRGLRGDVVIDSQPGAGTTVRIRLPVVPPQVDAPPARGPEVMAAGSGSVLLVEDEVLLRNIIARVLQQAGFHVLTVEDPDGALELLRGPEKVDLLLTDVVMPKLSGPRLFEACRALRPELPVLFMSGYPDRVSSGIPPHLEDRPLLHKPFTPAELTAAIARLLGSAPNDPT